MAHAHEGAVAPLQPISDREVAGAAERTSGVLLVVLAAQFMTVIMLAASMAPGYDYGAAAISDLGVIPQTALLFNASLVGVGVLNVAGGYLLYRSHRSPWVFGSFLVAGMGAVGAGVVPLDSSELHGLFALLAFLFFNVEAISCAAIVRGWMKAISMVAGLTGLAFVVVMVIGDAGNPSVFGPVGHGGAERMIVYPVMLWMLAFGGYLTRARREPAAGDETMPVRRGRLSSETP